MHTYACIIFTVYYKQVAAHVEKQKFECDPAEKKVERG